MEKLSEKEMTRSLVRGGEGRDSDIFVFVFFILIWLCSMRAKSLISRLSPVWSYYASKYVRR